MSNYKVEKVVLICIYSHHFSFFFGAHESAIGRFHYYSIDYSYLAKLPLKTFSNLSSFGLITNLQ